MDDMPNNYSKCSTDVVLNGIVAMHMRPVSLLVKISRQFEAEVFVEYNNKRANGKSLLDIIMLGIPEGARFTIFAIGKDASNAIRSIRNFFKRFLCDEIKEGVKFDEPISSPVNKVQTEKVKREVEMKEKKKMQMKAVAKECSTGECSSGCGTKRKARKPLKFRWPVEEEIKEVCLAGDFNNWTPQPMSRSEEEFLALMELEPGEYQYKFVVDGKWIPDPAASRVEPNPFGSVNSVVIVC